MAKIYNYDVMFDDDRINLTVEKGNKDIIKEHADKYDNGSVNGFINRAIAETMNRDKQEKNK